MLRRLSNAASLLSSRAATPSDDAPPVPSLPTSASNSSLASPSLTEALSYDLVNPPPLPSRTDQAQADLLKALEDLQTAGPGDFDASLGALATIQLVLQQEEIAETLIRNGGFEVVVGALASLGAGREGEKADEHSVPDGAASDTDEDDELRHHFATLIFHVLHLALSSSSSTIHPSSFSALSSGLELSGLIDSSSSLDDKTRTLSLLWSFLVGDFSDGASALLVARSRLIERLKQHEQAASLSLLQHVRAVVAVAGRGSGTGGEEVQHAQIFPVFLDILEKHLDSTKEDEAQVRLLSLVFVDGALVAGRGERNLVRLREAGVFEAALRRWRRRDGGEAEPQTMEDERAVWKGIMQTLLARSGAEGRNARSLFDGVEGEGGLDEESLEVVIEALGAGTRPSYVEFELSRRSSSLSLRSLGKPFPPPYVLSSSPFHLASPFPL
jgi:hypothetical protein